MNIHQYLLSLMRVHWRFVFSVLFTRAIYLSCFTHVLSCPVVFCHIILCSMRSPCSPLLPYCHFSPIESASTSIRHMHAHCVDFIDLTSSLHTVHTSGEGKQTTYVQYCYLRARPISRIPHPSTAPIDAPTPSHPSVHA